MINQTNIVDGNIMKLENKKQISYDYTMNGSILNDVTFENDLVVVLQLIKTM